MGNKCFPAAISRIAAIDAHRQHSLAALSPVEQQNAPAQPSSSHVNRNIRKIMVASLTQDHHRSLAQLLAPNQDLYKREANALARTSAAQHRIEKDDDLLIKSHPYRVSPGERRVISEHVDDICCRKELSIHRHTPGLLQLLSLGKNGSWRFCVDYCRVDKVTTKGVCHLPRIHNT